VSDPRDKSDSNPSPDPELNPLVNPLLAAHMGRWAEVYFTNPPEKRDQAVSELLRELENVSPPESSTVQGFPDPNWEKKTETADSPNLSSSALEPGRTCPACAYYNEPSHEFCGMCGAPLPVSPETRVAQVAEAASIAGDGWHERSLRGRTVEDAFAPAVRSAAAGEWSAASDLSGLLPEKGISHRGVESEPVSYRDRLYRYRLYIAAGLAILLFVLGYAARRGSQSGSDTAATPSATAIPHTQPAPANSAQPPSATRSALPTGAPLSPQVQDKNQVDTSSQRDQTADSPFAPPTLPVAASSSAVAQNGGMELATAEKYLNGAPGTTRDSAEAAQWLWKAVGKQNLEATLALSDLYLRGDGVPKSCDQARLLLDAAARKGAKAAAERLRNLQASGCQ
jgi:hypothetical protein